MATMGVLALKWQSDLGWPLSAFMVGLVFSMGITTMWFLGKQAATDIYTRGFALIGKEAAKTLKS